MMKQILFALMILPAAMFAQGAALDDIQRDWAQANYQLEDKAQVEALTALKERTEAAVAASQGSDASMLIWDGIVKSTLAGKKGGLSALSLVKAARKSLEKAIEIDPAALDGSAYTSLGALYYQVPGWPLGFGDDDTARKLLNKAVAMNPHGIDSNYFYGDFLAQQKETAAARAALEHALAAPDRPDRPVADAGRRAEIRQLLETLSN
jgi:tetratricopeptide (TPR) repeat protein